MMRRLCGSDCVVKPVSVKKSPLDVEGVNTNLSVKEIVDIAREIRER